MTTAIIGATGAVGRALAKRVAARGATPWLIGRNADALAALSQDLGGAPTTIMDCAQPEAIADAFKAADAELAKSVRGLAYCAGSIVLKPARRAALDDFRGAMDLNVYGAVEALKALEKPLKKNGGSVVLFSTVAVQQGLPNHAVVSAAKGAIEGLSRALAAELAPAIRVNAVAPSLSESAMAEPMLGNEKMAEALAKAHPLQRVGKGDDIAAMADFLLSEDSSWITGQVIGVDGGRHAVA
mmetsp:Transcript_22625/g.67883  ORF Transcript_22625/g.67883 Transcript_22625/m.67883 type:complete len:241 (+) Transcript_22625:1800-2522(+)